MARGNVAKSGVVGWVEDGERHPLRLVVGFESIQAIPTSTVAVAFKAYEVAHPGEGLPELTVPKDKS